MSYQNISLVQI